MKQRIEQTQQFMFTVGIGTGISHVTLQEIAEEVKDFAGTDVYFKVNSLELCGYRGAVGVKAKDTFNREIVSTSILNEIEIPLPTVVKKYSKGVQVFGKDLWLSTADVLSTLSKDDFWLAQCDGNPTSGSTVYSRWEVRITFFKPQNVINK